MGVEVRPSELLGRPNELLGDAGPGAGDDDSEPALKGWKDTDVRRTTSPPRSDDFDP